MRATPLKGGAVLDAERAPVSQVIPRHPATIGALLWNMVADGTVRTDAKNRFIHNRLFAAADSDQ
jgi:hypothetical protein